MKKIGRGRAYRQALLMNLLRSLVKHRKITTTAVKAKKIKQEILKKHGGLVKTFRLTERRGDNASQVRVVWESKKEAKENDKDKTDSKSQDSKAVASR